MAACSVDLTHSNFAATEPGLTPFVERCKSDPQLLTELESLGGCENSRKVAVSVDIVIALAATYFIATYLLLIGKLRSYRSQAYTVVQVGIVYHKLQVPPDPLNVYNNATCTNLLVLL